MAKYQATQLLWSPSANRYIRPGEEIELEGEFEKILLDKNCIKPAVYHIYHFAQLEIEAQKQKTKSRRSKKDGTNNR